jgi:fatty acid desaturase
MQDFESRNPSSNKLKDIFSHDELKKLHKKSRLRAIEGIARAWIPVFAVFYIQSFLSGTWFWIFAPIGIFVVASRQHAMAGLTHEAVHNNFFKSKAWNDFVGRFLCAFPIFVSFSKYKKVHMEHHRHLYTDKDPDVPIYMRYPVLKKKLVEILRKDFFGKSIIQNLNYLAELPSFLRVKERVQLEYKSDKAAFYLFHAAVIATALFCEKFGIYVLFWIVPYCTLLQVFLRIRAALEHGAVSSTENPLQNTRTVTDSAFVLSFMAPLGLNYHLEHHLYPAVPWYQLHKLHACIESKAKAKVNFEESYLSGINRLIR